MLILSETELASMSFDAHALVDALDAAFRCGPEQSITGLKAQTPGIDGGVFQALPAVLANERRASLKWISVAGGECAGPRIRTTTLFSDAVTGETLALMSSSRLTAIRTAAMSALAARHLWHADPARMASGNLSIGFLGCGVQALAHLDMFASLYPQIRTVLAHAPSSGERFAEQARARGFNAYAERDAARVIREADLVISSVPMRAGQLAPHYDATMLKPTAFASFVDLGRPWIPLDLDTRQPVFTDYVVQSDSLVRQGKMKFVARFAGDLYTLARGEHCLADGQAAIYVFGGLGMCDTVISQIAYRQALSSGIGTHVEIA
ncbi:hypothetical protein [Chitinasiproducens palmae]|uniref:Ornithine cyclodeaminase n=1 Tax=Chitinasiproducens palmae TaxID=1770053 RepID=A0A1H2PU92_9BURK|nr:hypothetical protein [Chitinasiproducens palmae]SDV50728.1 ornithine cyclodeaminase [Chitinasiproducens palmae]